MLKFRREFLLTKPGKIKSCPHLKNIYFLLDSGLFEHGDVQMLFSSLGAFQRTDPWSSCIQWTGAHLIHISTLQKMYASCQPALLNVLLYKIVSTFAVFFCSMLYFRRFYQTDELSAYHFANPCSQNRHTEPLQ